MENPNRNFFSRRRWLARLSFSFLIVAVALVYSGYHGGQTQEFSHTRVVICYIAAAMAFSMFLMGTRERHRRDEDDEQR